MKNFYTILFVLASAFAGRAQGQFDIPNLSIRLIEGTDTLGNAWAGGLNSPQISEIDADFNGFKDLFMYDRSNNRISVFLNNGSTTGDAYHYNFPLASKFPPVNGWALLYDYDNDGLEDFFTLALCNCGIAVYKNTSTAPSNLEFTFVVDPLLEQHTSGPINIYATALAVPAFSDIDNDGDMDILGYNSVPDGRIQYHRNYSIENWGIPDSLNFNFEDPTWGFFTLQIGGTNSVNCYSCRTTGQREPLGLDPQDPSDYSSGSEGAPSPSGIRDDAHYYVDGVRVQGNPGEGVPGQQIPSSTAGVQRQAPYYLSEEDIYHQSQAAARDDSNTSIYAIDLDGDNDKELLVGDITARNTLMVCNGGTPTAALMDSTCSDTLFPSYDVPILLRNFASHAYIDVDNDGIRDLLASPERTENRRTVWFYKNTGTNSVPVFDFITNSFLVSDMMDVGEGASPVFFDQNLDGYPDMIVGNYGEYNPANGQFRRRLALYQSTGTPSNPEFTLVTRDFASIGAMLLDGPLYPAFGDLNNDGTEDMVLGCGTGALHYFLGAGNPVAFTLAQANFATIDVGDASTPQLVDLNNDSKLDLIVGEQSGFLNYFENIGTFNNPAFSPTPTIDTLGGINVRTPLHAEGYSVPFVYYDNGDYNLWVSCSQGDVYEYLDITNNLYSNFPVNDTLIHKFEGDRLPYNLAASGTYIDTDNIIDMGLGLWGGGIQFFTSINPTAVQPVAMPEGFTVFPNPANHAVTINITSPLLKLPATLFVFNALGQQVAEEKMMAGQLVLDLSQLPEGMYFVRLESAQGAFVKKIVVQRPN